MEDHLKRLREERAAREQARIQKLREMNMKKYPKSDLTATNQPIPEKRTASTSQIKTGAIPKQLNIKNAKSSVHVNCTRRPTTVPVTKKTDYTNIKPKVITKFSNKTDTKIINKNFTVTKNAGDVPKSATKVKNTTNKPSTSNFDTITKPDIIITENSDNDSDSVVVAQKLDTKTAVTKNAKNKGETNNDVPCKPDILITTQGDTKSNKNKVLTEITKRAAVNSKLFQKNDVKTRKSFAPSSTSSFGDKPKINARKSMLPKLVEGTKSESVFDRLYKPKNIKKPTDISEAEKLRTDPKYLKQVVRNADLIFNMHRQRKSEKFSQRRSISAVHFKRINKSEVNNCIHKWGSIGDKLDKVDLNEDITIKDNEVTSAVKSERKKVQFLTPGLSSFNSPRPDELQARLKSWLQKRGKSLSSYHHLQCFGIHHLKADFGTPKTVSSVTFEDAIQSPHFDEENKENIALDSDSDDGSYTEIMDKPNETVNSGNKIDITNWRDVSLASESVFNDSNRSHKFNDVTLTPASVTNVDDLLYGALNDLSALLREGFEWQQAARWLRSIRARFPAARRAAAYWECRAALEDARGDLTASLHCWNEAIATGTETSVADSNLDQLLNKFMQLEISPQSGARRADPKLVDVKNVFKSTIIKFAVQQAKLRNKPDTPPVFTVTPVRRSARLSRRVSRTPLRLCDTVRQAATLAPEHVFQHNDHFVETP